MFWYDFIGFFIGIGIFGWFFIYSYGNYLETLALGNSKINYDDFYYHSIVSLMIIDTLIGFICLGILLSHSFKTIYYVITDTSFLCCVFIPTFIIIMSSIVCYYKRNKNPIYIKYNRISRVKEQMTMVENFLDTFSRERTRIKDDWRIVEAQKEESVSIIDSYIVLLKDIYAELRISLSMIEMNYAVEQFKDIELSESNLESLSKQIDKMKAYRSLGEVSQELKDLLKKYDGGKISKTKD